MNSTTTSTTPKRSALKNRHEGSATAAASTDTCDYESFITDATAPSTPNDGANDTITVFAHVRDKSITVHCGFGTQQVMWLGHVAIARYNDNHTYDGWRTLGAPTAMTKAIGSNNNSNKREALRLTDLICDVLHDKCHVYITTSRN